MIGPLKPVLAEHVWNYFACEVIKIILHKIRFNTFNVRMNPLLKISEKFKIPVERTFLGEPTTHPATSSLICMTTHGVHAARWPSSRHLPLAFNRAHPKWRSQYRNDQLPDHFYVISEDNFNKGTPYQCNVSMH